MLRIVLTCVALSLCFCNSSFGQLTCEQCQVGGDAGCSDVGPWDRDFFGCGHKSMSDEQVCDPCCGKSYFSLFGGATHVENFHRQIALSATMTETQGPALLDGYALGGALGYRVHPQLRLEAEYTYRNNKPEAWFTGVETSGVLTALARDPAAGIVETHSLMFNSVYDVTRPRVGCANLYGGGGIGLLHANSVIAIPASTYDISDTAFAWQLIGGVNFAVNHRVDVFTEYRYLGADSFNVVDTATLLPFGDFNYDSHNVMFGFRINR
jgi:opacity protein-like surface antigen